MEAWSGIEASFGIVYYAPGAAKIASRANLTAGLSSVQSIRARPTWRWYGVAASTVRARWTRHRKSDPLGTIVSRRTWHYLSRTRCRYVVNQLRRTNGSSFAKIPRQTLAGWGFEALRCTVSARGTGFTLGRIAQTENVTVRSWGARIRRRVVGPAKEPRRADARNYGPWLLAGISLRAGLAIRQTLQSSKQSSGTWHRVRRAKRAIVPQRAHHRAVGMRR